MVRRIHGLEALRGVAAIVVAFTHAAYLSGTVEPAERLFDKGYLAVDLFFILSGFVLARTYEGRMPGPRDFFEKRFARLWKLIAIGVVLGAIYSIMRGMDLAWLLPHLVAGLLIAPVASYAIVLNPPAWSIFFELVANVCHAAFLGKLRLLQLVGIVGICSAILLAYIGPNGLDVGQSDRFWLGFPRVLMGYVLGIVLYRVNQDRIWIPSVWAWPVVMSFPGVVWLAGLGFPPWAEVTTALFVCPAIILGALAMHESRIAALLGALSFPLYAVHWPVQWITILLGGNIWQAMMASLIGSTVIAMIFDARSRDTLLSLFVRPTPLAKTAA